MKIYLPDISKSILLNKILLSGIFLLVYVVLLRPVRNTVFAYQFNSTFTNEVLAEQKLNIMTLQKRAVVLEYENNTLKYTIPFGLYFLLAGLGLILLNAGRFMYLLLAGIHFLSLILAMVFFWAVAHGNPDYLMGTDLLTRYLIPFCSLALIPLAYIQKQQSENERKA